MSQRVIITLSDDIDGSLADRTVSFSIDGESYEIDLSAMNEERLRSALAPFVDKARTKAGSRSVSRRAKASSSQSRPSRTDREQLQAMRIWARDHGMQVADRGRVSERIRTAFQEAHVA